MMKCLLIALFGVSLINAAFFGCTMRAGTNATVGGYGAVVCNSGQDDTGGTEVNTMACEFQYYNLTTNPTVCHFHVGDDTTPNGPVTYTFGVSGKLAAQGAVYQKFVASDTATWTQRNGLTFDQQVTACASGTGCYFNLHTSMFTGGELRCQLQPMTNLVYDFTTGLSPPAAVAANATFASSTGTATVQMATVQPAATPALHAWGYQVSFNLGSPITLAHIHQGTTTSDNGPVKVTFDQGPQRMSGKFVGVALEGVVPTLSVPPSSWPTYTSDFDTAMTNHFNYINVHSVANPGGEVRAQISPIGSSASKASLALLVVFFMIASWMTL